MVKRKAVRTRGKLQLSKYFQKFEQGEHVAVKIEKSVDFKFPKRIQGRTGTIKEKKGRAYAVLIKDQDKEKQFIISPIHLKKIKTSEEQGEK